MSANSLWTTQATIEADQVILKLDIEGHECKALPREIILGSSEKRIPFIFIEWMHLVRSADNRTDVNYMLWHNLSSNGNVQAPYYGIVHSGYE